MLSHMWEPFFGDQPSKRRRRGGWRQRLEAGDDGPPAAETTCSSLAAGHLLEWADGTASAAQLRRQMANGVRDKNGHPMVRRLAAIGGDQSEQHCQAGLLAVLEKCSLVGLIERVPGGDELATHVIRPSTLIRALHDNYYNRFRVLLGADRTRAQEFWQGLLSSHAG